MRCRITISPLPHYEATVISRSCPAPRARSSAAVAATRPSARRSPSRSRSAHSRFSAWRHSMTCPARLMAWRLMFSIALSPREVPRGVIFMSYPAGLMAWHGMCSIALGPSEVPGDVVLCHVLPYHVMAWHVLDRTQLALGSAWYHFLYHVLPFSCQWHVMFSIALGPREVPRDTIVGPVLSYSLRMPFGASLSQRHVPGSRYCARPRLEGLRRHRWR